MPSTRDLQPTGDELRTLRAVQAALYEVQLAWLEKGHFEAPHVRKLHALAATAMHRLYCTSVPAYFSLASEAGLVGCCDAATIRVELALSEAAFKSYDVAALERRDFVGMSAWLDTLTTRRIGLDARRVESVEEWLAVLAEEGLSLSYSSGTSGVLSFVPRDQETLDLGSAFGWARLERRFGANAGQLRDFHAVLLGHRGGSQGFARFVDGIGRLAKTRLFLHDYPILADRQRMDVRAQQQRPGTGESNGDEFARVTEALSALARRSEPVLIVGTPPTVHRLCACLRSHGPPLRLGPGSTLMVGGGWKTASDSAVSWETLVSEVGQQLGIGPGHVDEAYSMIECNAAMHRCSEGRIHIPPQLWPFVAGQDFRSLPLPNRGRFGFADPLAMSYPGFCVTADEVMLTDEPCLCRVGGMTIVGEIGRAAGCERRGCAVLPQASAR